ncbi:MULTISPECIES: CATRA conflict system CASPASE/TPR repeat-associated protein [unclassified Streptomyces]|uniref:CATRA conflict system CASPASE/TPR repeat-associated protein n=1 Tax=unclassified Streptomyces TaxID=2593676 RepID=UPI001E353FA1|nr:CATRA conflict system CASPASE/TPR repeat-associated protein [Streptomyces sp. CB02980]MCB8905546.1 BN6_48550 family protein [Streptomyces sp. CB02980]
MLQAEALGVHVFVVTTGDDRHDALAFVRNLWNTCGEMLGMNVPVEGTGTGLEPGDGWDACLPGASRSPDVRGTQGLLATRNRPGPGVWQAALRREHDALCLSVMLAPDAADGLGWAELDGQWSGVLRAAQNTQRHEAGVLGSARLYLARLAEPDLPTPSRLSAAPSVAPEDPLTTYVSGHAPNADDEASTGWPYGGVIVPQGFAVWETSASQDARDERRLLVVAAHDRDPELTAWVWTTRTRALPPLGKYLLHTAKLRYQLRVWDSAETIGRLRAATDKVVGDVLEKTDASQRGASHHSELLDASRALVDLQTRERGLVDRSTRSREMSRTVEIAAANFTTLSGDPDLGGLFADDRALSEWFIQRLDDDATYLEAAVRRCTQVGVLADQLIQRSLQRRQETVNLGLTGAIGAILMSLAAVQSLQYTVPLPGSVKPAVVAALGALALLASLVVLRVVVPERRWPLAMLRLGAGALGGTVGWVVASALGGSTLGPGWTWLCGAAGTAVALATAAASARRGDRGGGT